MNNNIKSNLRKGLWSPEEDEKLIRYMITKGQRCWSDSYIKYEVIEAFSFLSYDVDCECDEDL